MLGTPRTADLRRRTCVVRAVLRWTEVYKHESCGKCTPCREGTWWLAQTLTRLERGQGTEADLELSARPVRQRPRSRVLRARRRRDQTRSPRRSSTSATSTSRTSRRAGVPSTTPPPPSSHLREHTHERLHHLGKGRPPGAVEKADLVTVTIDDVEVSVPKDTLVIRRRRGDRRADTEILRPPAARAGRRLPPVPRRGRGRRQRPSDPQAAGVLHARGGRRHEGSHPGQLLPSPTRRSRGSWSSC